MPNLAWDNHTAILPLDSSLSPCDLTLWSDQIPNTPHHTHRAVLASASALIQSVLQDCCACLHTSIILPEVSNNILQQLLVWLYTGNVELVEENQRLEWIELATRLGIGVEKILNEYNEDDSMKSKKNFDGMSDSKVVVKKQTVKKSMSDKLMLKYFKCLTINDSLSKYTRESFCEVDIFTSDDDSFAVIDVEKENLALRRSKDYDMTVDKGTVSSCVQCDLSFEEEELEYISDGDHSKDTQDDQLENVSTDDDDVKNSSCVEYHDATTSVGEKNSVSLTVSANNLIDSNCEADDVDVEPVHNETVYQDCEEEIDEQAEDDSCDDTVTDGESIKGDLFLGSDGSVSNESDDDSDIGVDDKDDDESDDDPSWRASGTDSSSHSDEDGDRLKKENAIPLGDITNVNFSTVNTSVLGVWLSDTGPVHMATRCLCKGSCVRNCVCRTGGGTCSRRCSCQPSKCRLRGEAEESKARCKDTSLLGKIGQCSQLSEQSAEEVQSQKSDADASLSHTPTIADTAAQSSKSSLQVLCTPSCPPIPLSASTSMLSTTAKKRNKKKLFTEAVGPQEM